MKRIGHLYEQIAEPDNLRQAFLQAARGKGDRAEVVRYRQNLQHNLASLRDELLNQKVQVGNYHFFKVFDPKERTICAAAFPERVLHHALMNIVEPHLERYAIFDSYACRRGKGQHAALKRAQNFSRRHSWYLKLDIRKYFDSIDQSILRKLLARRFKDRRLLALFDQCLASYATAAGKGLPIGNLVSQHLANFYLGYLDHYLKDDLGVKSYLRYMDDFILFADSGAQLKTLLRQIETFLHDELALELKNNIQLNRCERGAPLLGFRIYPQQILLSPRSRSRFVDKLRSAQRLFANGECSEAELARRVRPLVVFTQVAETQGFRRMVFKSTG